MLLSTCVQPKKHSYGACTEIAKQQDIKWLLNKDVLNHWGSFFGIVTFTSSKNYELTRSGLFRLKAMMSDSDLTVELMSSSR